MRRNKEKVARNKEKETKRRQKYKKERKRQTCKRGKHLMQMMHLRQMMIKQRKSKLSFCRASPYRLVGNKLEASASPRITDCILQQ